MASSETSLVAKFATTFGGRPMSTSTPDGEHPACFSSGIAAFSIPSTSRTLAMPAPASAAPGPLFNSAAFFFCPVEQSRSATNFTVRSPRIT